MSLTPAQLPEMLLRVAVVRPVMLWGQPGVGKALATDTPIPTPAGMRTMGELAPGDFVFGPDGAPTEVVAATEAWTNRECYEVVFSDGSTITADADHLWVTETEKARAAAQRQRNPRKLRERAQVGTVAERALTRSLHEGADSAAQLTVRGLATELGWDSARFGTLYRWSEDLTPVPGRPRRYGRADLLKVTLSHLEAFKQDRRFLQQKPSLVTTREMTQTLISNGKTNHAVRVAPPISLPQRDLPIPPRLLGLWLGDGTSASYGFTSADPELAQEFSSAGYTVRPVGSTNRYAYAITLDSCLRCGPRGVYGKSRQCRSCDAPVTWIGALRALGVRGNKHIPPEYLRSSESQRRELLRGLLDTDGTTGGSGQVAYTTTNRQLGRDVQELACSLGYRATLVESRATFDGRDIGPCWDINFTTPDEVFGLERKRQVHLTGVERHSSERNALRYVVDVRPVPSAPVRCIQVANSEGMFLVGHTFIATHNSSIVEQFAQQVGLPCITLLGTQLAPEDLIGVPQITPEGFSRFCPPESIARAEPYVLFLDELNSSSTEVQKAFYSLILDRRLGSYELPEGSVVIGAGNRSADSAITRQMSSALINRMVHIHLTPSTRDWLAWASEANIHPWVTQYITQRPDHLWNAPPKTEEVFSTPRSWHMLSDILHAGGEPSPDELSVIAAGTLSPAHASGFAAWAKTVRNEHTIDAILKGKASWPAAPEDRDLLYFLSEGLRARLVKELPADRAGGSTSGRELAHRAKELLVSLAELSPEMAQTVIANDSEGNSVLPGWFLVEVVRDIPHLVAARS